MKGESSFKDHDEGKASKRGTSKKQEPTATSSDVHMSDSSSSSSSNMVMRGTTMKHDDEQVREGRQQLDARHSEDRNDDETGEETKKQKLCNLDDRDSEGKLVENDPDIRCYKQKNTRERHGKL